MAKGKKIYYHVVMKKTTWAIVESEHKEPIKVLHSVNSYVNRKHAVANISDPKSRHYGRVKQFWGPKQEAKFKSLQKNK